MTKHGDRLVKIGDNAAAYRAIDAYRFRRSAYHFFCLVAYRDNFFVVNIRRDDRRLAENYAFAVSRNICIRRPERDSESRFMKQTETEQQIFTKS